MYPGHHHPVNKHQSAIIIGGSSEPIEHEEIIVEDELEEQQKRVNQQQGGHRLASLTDPESMEEVDIAKVQQIQSSMPVADPSAPVGSTKNPIRIIQQGSQYITTQNLNDAQLKQIIEVLTNQALINGSQAGLPNAIYNRNTNTRILFRVTHAGRRRTGHGMGSDKPRSRGRPPGSTIDPTSGKRARRDEEEDPDFEPDLPEEELLPFPIMRRKTKSRRVVRPPKHLVKDYRQIRLNELNSQTREEDSDGGYSDYEDEGSAERPSSHVGEEDKSFPCQQCARRFKTSTGVARHVRLAHTLDAPTVGRKRDPYLEATRRRARLVTAVAEATDDEMVELTLSRLAKLVNPWDYLLVRSETGEPAMPSLPGLVLGMVELHDTASSFFRDHLQEMPLPECLLERNEDLATISPDTDNITKTVAENVSLNSVAPNTENVSINSVAPDTKDVTKTVVENVSIKSVSPNTENVSINSVAPNTENVSINSVAPNTDNVSINSVAPDTDNVSINSVTPNTENVSINSVAPNTENVSINSVALNTENVSINSVSPNTDNVSINSVAPNREDLSSINLENCNNSSDAIKNSDVVGIYSEVVGLDLEAEVVPGNPVAVMDTDSMVPTSRPSEDSELEKTDDEVASSLHLEEADATLSGVSDDEEQEESTGPIIIKVHSDKQSSALGLPIGRYAFHGDLVESYLPRRYRSVLLQRKIATADGDNEPLESRGGHKSAPPIVSMEISEAACIERIGQASENNSCEEDLPVTPTPSPPQSPTKAPNPVVIRDADVVSGRFMEVLSEDGQPSNFVMEASSGHLFDRLTGQQISLVDENGQIITGAVVEDITSSMAEEEVTRGVHESVPSEATKSGEADEDVASSIVVSSDAAGVPGDEVGYVDINELFPGVKITEIVGGVYTIDKPNGSRYQVESHGEGLTLETLQAIIDLD